MEVFGEIAKKNNELGYGFVSVKGYDDVFISPDTEYNGTSFSNLKIGEKVALKVSETERGLFATSLSLAKSNKRLPEPQP